MSYWLRLTMTIAAICGAMPVLHAETEKQNYPPGEKFKRRVLLTLFINENHDKDTEYLSQAVADAFALPLTKTGNFTILNRHSIERYTQTMGITTRDIYKTENAVRLGKAVGADVVVVGRFITARQQVTIEAQAIDVQAGRLSVEDKAEVRTNSLMFDAIQSLAQKMSAPMAEKMQPLEDPPPPAEVVLDEEQVTAEIKKIGEKKTEKEPLNTARSPSRLFVDPGIQLLQRLGASEKNITYDGKYPFGSMNPGLALSVAWQSDLPDWKIFRVFDAFQYGATLSYAFFSGALDVTGTKGDLLLEKERMKLQVASIAVFLARHFSVLNFPLIAYAGFGADYAIFSASQGETLYKGVQPGAQAGIRALLYSIGAFETGLHYRLGFSYLNDGNSYLNHMLTITGGYRL
ncbi:MAG: hypothetical protein KF713_09340 [Turneriella sp.]|nr:hypothetical protein [Turneriella sp.]